MSSLLVDVFATIDSALKPIVPAGVTGVQFISVFFIVYAITLLVLKRVDLLKGNSSAVFLLALVIAYFTASSTFSVLLITKLFPNVGVVTILLISFIAVIGMVPTGSKKLTLAPVLVVFGVLFVALSTWQGVAGSLSLEGLRIPAVSREEMYGLIFLGIFIVISLLFMYGGGGGEKKNYGEKFWKFVKDFVGWEG